MQNSLISNRWCIARAGVILSAGFLLALLPMALGQQEPTPDAKDQKAKPLTGQLKPTREPIRVTPVEGQVKQIKNAEPNLEEMLNKALKDNPDIRVAESKVREAEAELNRTRLQVTQKVLAFHHTHEAQKATVKVAEEELARIRKFLQSKTVSQDEVQQAENRLAQAKAKLAEIDAEMPYLLGQEHRLTLSAVFTDIRQEPVIFITGKQMERMGRWSTRVGELDLPPGSQPVAATTLDKIRKALDTPVTVDYKELNAADILEDLKKKVPGISFHVLASTNPKDLHLDGTVPLAAALQLVEDTFMDFSLGVDIAPEGRRCVFAIRDYGILFTVAGRIPPGAIQLDDLLKEKALAEREKKPAEDQKSTGDKK